jgi:hypothetical protein
MDSLEEKPVYQHLKDIFEQGSPDEVWLPQLAQDKNWVVITMDVGKDKAQRGHLPSLCLELGLTHILLSPGINRRNNAFRFELLCKLWPAIMKAAEGPRGLRYTIGLRPVAGTPDQVIPYIKRLPLSRKVSKTRKTDKPIETEEPQDHQK